MSPLIPDWLVESGLSSNEIATLNKLWRHKGKTPPFHVWPGRDEILRCVRMNKDTLSRVLNDLEKKGFLNRKSTWRSGHKAVVFELLVPGEAIIRNRGRIDQENSPVLRDDLSTQSSEIRGVRSSETEGVQSSESEGEQSSEARGLEVIHGSKPKNKEREGSFTPSKLIPFSSTAESNDEWHARLALAWPDVDIKAQLEKAHKKRNGDVERGWFEKAWLPGVTAKAPRPGVSTPVITKDGPKGWRESLEVLRPGNRINSEGLSWSNVPESIRPEIYAATNAQAAS